MTLKRWLDTFVPFCAIAIDEAINTAPPPDYGVPLPGFLGKDFEETKRATFESLVRKALDEMIKDRPELSHELIGEDPEELAVTIAPHVARSILGNRIRR